MSTYFLCVRLCLNLTVPALGHEGQERKPRQTKGRALLRCSQVLGWVPGQHLCLQEQGLTKWPQLPFTGSGGWWLLKQNQGFLTGLLVPTLPSSFDLPGDTADRPWLGFWQWRPLRPLRVLLPLLLGG